MKTINLNLKSVVIPNTPPIKTKFKYVIGEPIFDIHEDAAKALGTTKDEYRKIMNSKEGYKELKQWDLEHQ